MYEKCADMIDLLMIEPFRDMESFCIIGKRGIIMEKPILSPDFTIEDIHKLREYNYYVTKDMTPQERIDYYNQKGRAFLKEIEESKLQKV